MIPLIEADTDGSFFAWLLTLDEKQLTRELNEHVAKLAAKWAVPVETRKRWELENPEIEMKMDVTVYPAGYWYKMKTYILLKQCDNCKGIETEGCTNCEGRGQTIKFTGGSFRDRRNPIMFDTVRDKLGWCRIENAPAEKVIKIISEAMQIERYKISDLIFSVSMSKMPDDYERTPWFAKIPQRALRELGWPVRSHWRYEYIYADNEDEIELAAIATVDDIDYEKYRTIIASLADRFGYGEYAWDWVTVPPLMEITELGEW